MECDENQTDQTRRFHPFSLAVDDLLFLGLLGLDFASDRRRNVDLELVTGRRCCRRSGRFVCQRGGEKDSER